MYTHCHGRWLDSALCRVRSRPTKPPGLSVAFLVFVLSIAAYVTPALRGGQMVSYMPTLIVAELNGTFRWPLGSALAITLSLATLICVAAFTMLTVRLMEKSRA